MKRVPFSVIAAAKKFDPEAVGMMFHHFEGYIASRCLSNCTGGNGNARSVVDDDLCYQAEMSLFQAIEHFQFRDPPDDFMR